MGNVSKLVMNQNYLYTASGQKTQKKVYTSSTALTTTDYLGGFQYSQINAGTVVLDFFPHAEGYVNNTVVSGNNVYSYVFNYTDHLGNIRLRYTRNTNGTLRILEQNHYYPFGLKHEKYNTDQFVFIPDPNGGYNSGVTTGRQAVGRIVYQYKLNGKEWQDELGLNMYAMDMRQYDPAIARWVVQDPVVHHNFSPYSAFDNNPVYWADPSGADSTDSQTDVLGRKKYDEWGKYIPVGDREDDGLGMYGDRSGEKETGPGALFDSSIQAAIDFGINYNGIAILESLEIFTLIYELDGKYGYTVPSVGAGGWISEKEQANMLNILSAIKGASLDAVVHTHGSDTSPHRELVKEGIMTSSANKFSGDYLNTNKNAQGDIHVLRNDSGSSPYGRPVKGYMIAPNGGLYLFDPSLQYGKKARDGTIHYEFKRPIYENLPSDPYQGKQRLNQIAPVRIPNLKFNNY